MACLAILIVYTGVWVYAESTFWFARLRDVTPAYRISNYAIRNQPPSTAHWLGTKLCRPRQLLGRSCKARALRLRLRYSRRSSSFLSVFFLGAMAGYFGRAIDTAIVYLFSVVGSVPDILLITAISYVCARRL